MNDPTATETVVDIVIHCPKCGRQHIDEPKPEHTLYKDTDEDAPVQVKEHGLQVCRKCGTFEAGLDNPCWDNRPHRSHECQKCGTIWRPADVCTNGVRVIKTRGQADTWPSVIKTTGGT